MEVSRCNVPREYDGQWLHHNPNGTHGVKPLIKAWAESERQLD